jgi:ABC-2 type transport system permease protein
MKEWFNISRFLALVVKELRQMKRNRRLVAMLVLPPTVNLLLFGVAMNPEVTGLRLGVVDDSHTAESRELVSAFVESNSFVISGTYTSVGSLSEALSAGNLDAGIVVPPDYSDKRARGETAEIQFLVDGVNSNTASVASGYVSRTLASLNARLAPTTVERGVSASVAVLYNPGLRSSWFIVSGMIGMLLVMLGSLAAAAAMVREKETGTIEQLLMTPAKETEVILAKIAPVFVLLTLDIGLALLVARAAFDLPIRGSLTLLFIAGSLCVLSGIGLGTAMATLTKTQAQAQLLSFFINPPLALLSGATTPVEAIPEWLRPVAALNPVYHFGVISRGVLLKGIDAAVLYPNLLALAIFATAIVGVSVWRFRRQMA